DDGLADLEKQDAHRHFLLINTNLVDPKTGHYLFTPYHIFKRAGLKIGVFGVIGTDSAWPAVSAVNQRGMKILDPVAVARQAVAHLKAQGADIVIMLSHSGFAEDKAMARKVRGISVIVGGHSHTKVPHPVAIQDGDWTTYVAQAFCYDRYLGRIDLTVDDGKVVQENGFLLPIAGDTPEDSKVATVVDRYADQIQAKMDVVIGQAPDGLSVSDKYDRDCPLGDWAADLVRARMKADVAILNSGGLRSALNPGPIHVGDVYTVFPFENRLVTLDMSGALLARQLDAVAAHKAGMLQMSGLTWHIDDGKATDIMIGGHPLDPAKIYKVATIDYVALGNDHYTVFPKGTHYQDSGVLLRDAILAGIQQEKVVEPPATGRVERDR
ncbi:MAG: 5'-nucleotidase C-terminal domain-containing protein, partial [Cyanobacteria bacterium REEB65]|nr:5'-nucleotidase C-terminal domain-containing protein [Cyanobacteria bacterium REEB65]